MEIWKIDPVQRQEGRTDKGRLPSGNINLKNIISGLYLTVGILILAQASL